MADKRDYQYGETTIQAFFDFINERHRIWCLRNNGLPRPWTDDPVLLDWSFTNVFRELDTGTIALKRMLSGELGKPYGKGVEVEMYGGQKMLINDFDLHLLRGKSVHLTGGKYAAIHTDNGKEVKVEHLILPPIPSYVPDHRNGNGLDNRRCNLRRLTERENHQNRVGYKEDGLPKNVYLNPNCKEKFQVQFTINGENVYVGRFATVEEAEKRAKEFRKFNELVDADSVKLDLVMFNIHNYRLWNLNTHADVYGFVYDPEDFYKYLRNRWENNEKIFTAAHLVSGRYGEDKIDTYIEASREAYKRRWEVVETAQKTGRMSNVAEKLQDFLMVGPFISYEIVCDMRFCPEFWPPNGPTDVQTWANVGPGAKRGMERLGLEPKISTMMQLWGEAPKYLGNHVRTHHPLCVYNKPDYPPFELREIEHSLCEFDKYRRVQTGAGRPRSKYNGRQGLINE
jgi:hypothetical protein